MLRNLLDEFSKYSSTKKEKHLRPLYLGFSKLLGNLQMYNNDTSLNYTHMGRCIFILTMPKEDMFIIPISQMRKQKLRGKLQIVSKEVMEERSGELWARFTATWRWVKTLAAVLNL